MHVLWHSYAQTPILTHTCACVQVGHTHNQLDGSFGQMSRNVYGRQMGLKL